MEVDKKKQGKKSRAAGQRFELKVRGDLEKNGWIVDKWTNNVELQKENSKEVSGIHDGEKFIYGKLIKAKPKFVFNPGLKRRVPMGMSSGFPDFIAIKPWDFKIEKVRKFGEIDKMIFQVIGVESKMNGILDKEEKEKCSWLLKNNIFSKILIAQKGEKRGEIKYVEFS